MSCYQLNVYVHFFVTLMSEVHGKYSCKELEVLEVRTLKTDHTLRCIPLLWISRCFFYTGGHQLYAIRVFLFGVVLFFDPTLAIMEISFPFKRRKKKPFNSFSRFYFILNAIFSSSLFFPQISYFSILSTLLFLWTAPSNGCSLASS